MSVTPLHLSFLIVTVILTTLWNSDHCAHFRVRLELKSRVGNRVSEQMPVVGLGSEKLVPSPALLAQWRDAEAFLMPHLPREALVQYSPNPYFQAPPPCPQGRRAERPSQKSNRPQASGKIQHETPRESSWPEAEQFSKCTAHPGSRIQDPGSPTPGN